MLLISSLIVIFVFIMFRSWLIKVGVKNNSFTDGDAINHLEFLRQIYKNNGTIPKNINKYILDTNDYPNGYYKLLYFLRITPDFANKYGGYLSLFWDVATIVLICVSIWLWGGKHFEWIFFIPFLGLWLAHVGRAFYFSPRPFGVFVTSLFLFGLVGFYTTGNFVFIAIALIGFIGFATSSQFGWQAATFYSLIFSIYDFSFAAIYAVLFSLSAIITKGYSLDVLKGLLRHSHFYKTFLVQIHPSTIQNKYLQIYETLKRPSFKKFVTLYRENSLVAFFSLMPLHYIALYCVFVGYFKIDIFLVWMLAGLVLVLLIATEPLKFLGEPERYLEYSTIPLFVVLSRVEPMSVLPIVIAVVLIAIVDTAQFSKNAFKLRQTNHTKEDSIKELLTFMSKTDNSVILAMPIRLSFMLGYFHETNKYVSWFANIGKGSLTQEFKELVPDRYAFPGSDVDGYVKKYDIQYIVAEIAAIKSAERLLNASYYACLKKHKVVFLNEFYIVLKTN
jgi:hypothetical protein